jgi:glycosyltransferase involved in cell wall biosynthesis
MGFHGTDFFLGDSLFYSAVDTAFAVSPHVADLAERRIKKRPVLLPNPVAVDFFNPGAAAIGSQSKLTIAASGRLVGWKGFHVLVDAVAYLRAANIPVEACLAGEGPEREALEKQIDSAGLNKEFKLVGKLDPESLRAMLRNSTVYAAPSIGMEAFSIAALEALSVGLPLVATDQIGLTAYLTERDYLSCPARDARALAQKLTIALKRQRDSAWTDQAARHKRIREQFAPEPIAARLVEIIEQIRK